jgi:hypothetical protein
MRPNKLPWRKTAQKRSDRLRVFMDLYAPQCGQIMCARPKLLPQWIAFREDFTRMTPPSEPGNELHVSRTDSAQALKTAAQVIGKFPGHVGLRFDAGSLTIEASGTVAITPARGFWPVPIFVGASWVVRMGKRLPPGDPIQLRVEAGRLYVNRYSEACSLTAAEHVVSNELSKADEALLILEAARILRPLRIGTKDLEKLVAETYVNGPISPSAEERKMLSTIAKAWVLLAPLGVGTDDLRQLVDNAVRNAWK